MNHSLSSRPGIEWVISTSDPVLRNLRITQSYHEITLDFAALAGRENICWCGFATWASRQAGVFIRGEQAPEGLREWMDFSPDRPTSGRPWYFFLLPPSLRFRLFTRMTAEEVSAQIAAGNLLVYSKLAPLFADFLELMRRSPEPDPPALAHFLDSLKTDQTTHAEIKNAFSAYHRALFSNNLKEKAEWFFLANVLVGLHEQIRLQEAIDGALAAPVRQALEEPYRFLGLIPLPPYLRKGVNQVLKWLIQPAFQKMEKAWKLFATRTLMTLDTPTGTIRLGVDLPLLPGGVMFPPDLRIITQPEVAKTLADLDLTPNTTSGSAAGDWTQLRDRMNFIADLFRSRQQDPTLYSPPLENSQFVTPNSSFPIRHS